MHLTALGVNHHSAPIAVREQLTLAPDRVADALAQIKRMPGIEGAMLLSTCNRTEIYLQHQPQAANDIVPWYVRQCQASEATIAHFYLRQQSDAVRHVFRVASGLDSLVLGEPQILGQLKSAYADARAHHTLSPNLDRLVQQSFAVAKDVRSSTGLGLHAVSIASSAVKLIKQIYDRLATRQVLLVGAGETSELIARHLFSAGIRRITVLNRTIARAHALCTELSLLGNDLLLHAGGLAELPGRMADADLLIAATSAQSPVIDAAMVKACQRQRRGRTLLLVDLGVPRDIEPAIAKLENCYLYGVDDLKGIADDGLAARVEAAKSAELKVDVEVQAFMRWLEMRNRIDPMLAIRLDAEHKRDAELARALHALQLGGDPQAIVERLAHQLTNQFLHAPTTALREAAQSADDPLIDAARALFKLGH